MQIVITMLVGVTLFLDGARACAQDEAEAAAAAPRQSSGGKLLEEQACYDVLHYELDLRVDPEARAIGGSLTMTARLLSDERELALHLDGALTVARVLVDGAPVGFSHTNGLIFVEPSGGFTRKGELFTVRVEYGGAPRVAKRPPWDGGFTWAKTASGAHWIATSCQGEGADLWWPCKDHPSDKPDSFDLHFTVPAGLVVATNGRHMAEVVGADGWVTSHWHVSTPIQNYGVALNVAPYVRLDDSLTSVDGKVFPVHFWALPENADKARALLPEVLDHLRFFEEVCGPYPFRADKYGVAETPHLGMEHQSIIAYGYGYRRDRDFDYDWLHHHELAHEWWANLVTCHDWNDFWIHEGVGTYMQALYLERRFGFEAYKKKMALDLLRVLNRGAVAPRGVRTTSDMYFSSDRKDAPDIDIYMKGSWVCHTLRWHLGDDVFFKMLRSWAYPDPAREHLADGSAVRFATTDELREIAEGLAGHDLGWFFEVYVRQPALPRLIEERAGTMLTLRWEVPKDLDFPLAVPVRVGDELRRIEVPRGGATLEVGDAEVAVDPDRWLLRELRRAR